GKSVFREDFHHDFIYSARDRWDDVMEKSRSITTLKYKYIRNDMPEVPYDDHQAYLEFHRPALHIMRILQIENQLTPEQKESDIPTQPVEELYEYQNGPKEQINLVSNPDYAAKLEKTRSDLKSEEICNTPSKSTYHPQP